jgi:hypothetical protein
LKICEDIGDSKCTAGVVEIGGKFTAGIVDIGGKLTANVNDTGGHTFPEIVNNDKHCHIVHNLKLNI